jgi:tetratricopeptide (TPR) repeat protein
MIRKVGGGWFQEALDAFGEMPEHEQLDDRNRVLLGYLLLLAGAREDEALDVLEELADQDEGALVLRYPLILYLLGRAEYEMSRFRSAFDHLLEYDRLERGRLTPQ